ncbi:hypothetical protein [Anaerocolumna sp. MB42-C2]|uniref:hypothetical protein n=1 Tax=Anaerocolumna sp. MB42-C2 TaxID=3070997 RepID=UPI0027E1263F|nr:hypothetical protein [Anaerocolumna sp. MB42-C2]WMJ86549.1 hypothetical protein RBU59_21290 [Anaerocolumna sp. MB42-C2]
MNISEPLRLFPLPTDSYMLYKGGAFDGCFFYLTMPQNLSITKFDTSLRQMGVIKVNKQYSCICYDTIENCFWASVTNVNIFLYKLDTDMKEIDRIRINKCNRILGKISGLSFHCNKNSLLVTYRDSILEIQKNGDTKLLSSTHKGYYTAALSIAPYYIVSLYTGNEPNIALFSDNDELIELFTLPKVYRIEDIIFYPENNKDKKEITVFVLATKNNCYPHLLQYNLNSCCIELNGCNYKYPNTFNDPKAREQSISDLIESIALVETALSHILNGLGEKIQKTNQMADNICDMLEVNKSINKTIMNVTQLEHILYAKLDTLSSISPQPCLDDKKRHN